MNAKEKFIAAKMADKKKKKKTATFTAKRPTMYTDSQLSGGRALEGLMVGNNYGAGLMARPPMGGGQ